MNEQKQHTFIGGGELESHSGRNVLTESEIEKGKELIAQMEQKDTGPLSEKEQNLRQLREVAGEEKAAKAAAPTMIENINEIRQREEAA